MGKMVLLIKANSAGKIQAEKLSQPTRNKRLALNKLVTMALPGGIFPAYEFMNLFIDRFYIVYIIVCKKVWKRCVMPRSL